MADPQKGGRSNGVTSFLSDLPPISSAAVPNTKTPSPQQQSDLQVSKVPKLPHINNAERNGTATMVPPGGIIAGLAGLLKVQYRYFTVSIFSTHNTDILIKLCRNWKVIKEAHGAKFYRFNSLDLLKKLNELW